MISQFSSKFLPPSQEMGTGTGPMIKGMGVWKLCGRMQAARSLQVRGGGHLNKDDIGSVGSCGSCSCRRKRTLGISAAR
jgi:hypothetical protein